ncbi:MAG: hypothetical protein IPL17_04075 [Anaerolineales bacterium]|nr:hypothetical protein [Anaerolineales bacterium]
MPYILVVVAEPTMALALLVKLIPTQSPIVGADRQRLNRSSAQADRKSIWSQSAWARTAGMQRCRAHTCARSDRELKTIQAAW